MISSSEMGYLIILKMKLTHIVIQNKSRTIHMSVDKAKTHIRKKNENKNVKTNTKDDRNGQMV